MLNKNLLWIFTLVSVIALPSFCFGQPGKRKGRQSEQGAQNQLANLLDDPKLLRIHKEFSDEAMKIAKEYERDRDFDGAMAVYRQVIRLIPQHAEAKSKLSRLLDQEKKADRILLQVDAAKSWQPTGIKVIAGKPITILAEGSWTFTLKRKLDPNGMAIPKELKDFNLGCLVGVIDSGQSEKPKPFVVGAKKEFVPKESGILYLRMYDVDVTDNEGEVDVQITGTFERAKRGSR